MNIKFLMLPLVLSGPIALGNSNFVSHPATPYPPGCADTVHVAQAGWLDAQAIKFHETTVRLSDRNTGEVVPLHVEGFRSFCAEADRSLLWLRFSISEELARQGVEVPLPSVLAQVVKQGLWQPLRLVSGPGTWGGGANETLQERVLAAKWTSYTYGDSSQVNEWTFLVDTYKDSFWGRHALAAPDYNDRFTLSLGLGDNFFQIASFDVPATWELAPVQPPELPLSGRLSGTWVVRGAADQGFQFAISEQLPQSYGSHPRPPPPPPSFFFTQFTFNAQGKPMWLVGNASFPPGATSLSFPVQVLHDGVFRGAREANRVHAGMVTLTVRSCNDVEFAYDYGALGLGQGVRRLQRLFSLEVAGYDCRDYAARVEANR